MKGKSWLYFNMLPEKDDKDAEYIWGRIQINDNRIIFWHASNDAFTKAVNDRKIKGTIELQCMKPNGVDHIRDALINAQKMEKPEGTKIHVYVVAAPKYALEVQAKDYKEAESILQKVSETAIKTITTAGGTGVFQRAK